MSRKVSSFTKEIFIASIITSLLFIYLIYNDKYVYITALFLMYAIVFLSFLNAGYIISNIQSSLIQQMNIKKEKIYSRLYIWGSINYVPMFITVIIYSFIINKAFLPIGLLLLINETVNIFFVLKHVSIKALGVTTSMVLIFIVVLFLLAVNTLL